MKERRAFILDLDGTLYRGHQPIEDAGAFVNRLRKANIPFLFVTNNSTLPPREVAKKLTKLGVEAHAGEIITSSQGVSQYLKNDYRDAVIYAIGEAGLFGALHADGLHVLSEQDDLPASVDFVVVGMDRQLTYQQLKRASLYVQKGAKLVGTNPDLRLPTEEGFLPGSGTITTIISLTCGVDPLYIGKPEPALLKQAAERLQADGQAVWAIGDNLETDIQGAVRAGFSSALVLTGYSKRADLAASHWQPTLVVETLTELAAELQIPV